MKNQQHLKFGKKIISVFITFTMLICQIPAVFAADSQTGKSFYDSFDNTQQWKTDILGEWIIEQDSETGNKILTQNTTNAGGKASTRNSARAAISDKTWTDAIYEFDVRYAGQSYSNKADNWFGVSFRKNSAENAYWTDDGYMLYWAINGNMSIGTNASGKNTSVKADALSNSATEKGEWHHLKILNVGNNMKAFIDGKSNPECEWTDDSNNSTSGYFTLNANASTWNFDNLYVRVDGDLICNEGIYDLDKGSDISNAVSIPIVLLNNSVSSVKILDSDKAVVKELTENIDYTASVGEDKINTYTFKNDTLSELNIGTYTVEFTLSDNSISKYTLHVDSDVQLSDKTELISLISEAQGYAEIEYSAESWASLQTALADASIVCDKYTASQSEVDTAAENLRNAIDGLCKRVTYVDKTPLTEIITKAESLNKSDYIPLSFERMTPYIDEAKAALNNMSLDQNETDIAYRNLRNAINNLEVKKEVSDMEYTKIVSLKTDDLVNPYGIDNAAPAFSWQMESNIVGQKQTAYQITVSTDSDMSALVWDSEKVENDKSVGIKYEGQTLKSSATYYWQVKVWDKDGKVIASPTAKFTTALMDADAWKNVPFIGVGTLPITNAHYAAEGEFTASVSNAIGLVFNYMDNMNMTMWQLDNSKAENGAVTLRLYSWVNAGVRNDRNYDHSDITNAYTGHSVNLTETLGITPANAANIPVKIHVEVDNNNIVTYVNDMQIDSFAPSEISGFVPYMGFVGARAFRGQTGSIHSLKLTDYSKNTQGEIITDYDFTDFTSRTPNPLTQGISADGKINLSVGTANKNVPALATNSKSGAKIFRKEFTTDRQIKSAVLYSTAMGLYDTYINGERVGELREDDEVVYDELKPGYTDGYCRLLYQSYDVTHMLDGSTNTISAIVTNGRWADDVNNNFGDLDTAFAAQLHLTYEDGTTEIIKTDASWNAYYGSNISYGDIYHGEVYDANADMSWQKNGFDTSTWTKGKERIYYGKITAHRGQHTRIRNDLELKPMRAIIYEGSIGADSQRYGLVNKQRFFGSDDTLNIKKGETAIIDFGQNFAGWEELELEGAKGTEVSIRHAEMLNDKQGLKSRGNDGPEGSVYLANLRSAKATSIYKMNGEGKEIYSPSHTYYGFRYLEITASDDITIHRARGKVLTSIEQDAGRIFTSDRSVNQLFSNTKWGQYSNYLSIITDCPQRDERQGWGGDAQVFSITGAYNAETYGFVSKWLQDMRDSQSRQKSGTYGVTAPYWTATGALNRSTAWADAGVIMPYNMYKMYSDKSIIEENYSSMQTFVDKYMHGEGEEVYHPAGRGCDRDYGDWLFDELNTTEMKEYLGCVYLAWDYQMMAEMAEVLDKAEDVMKYQTWFDEVKAYYNKTYVNADGSLKLTQPTAYLYALKLGLLPNKESEQTVLNALVTRIEGNGNKLETGFLGTAILLQTLTDFGRGDIAYKLLLQRQNPSWLYTVDQGATTVWERWNSYSFENGYGDVSMNSFNHFSFGVVCEWMYSYMSGIMYDFENPGFKHIILQPFVDTSDKITFTDGSYNSVYGRIESNWEKKEGKLYYSAVVPANTTATLYLPILNCSEENINLKNDVTDSIIYLGTEIHNGIKTAKFKLLPGGYNFVADNDTVSVSLQNSYIANTEDKECDKITASYTSDGTLIDVKVEKVKVSEIDEPQNTETEKVFYWDSLESMKPVKINE